MCHAPSPLVGRAAILTAIGRGAREGRSIVLTGASGSGGTRVLADALAATRRAGIRAGRLVPSGNGGSALSLVSREATGPLSGANPAAVRAATGAMGLEVVFLDDAERLDEEV